MVASGCEVACFKPFQTYILAPPKRGITLDPRKGWGSNPMTLPCGQCMGCRVDRSREWAVRLHHEASLHTENSFLTLTYDDDFLPENYSVSVREIQLFMKRLRKSVGTKVRFFACGEYGEKNLRPHYHVLVFGHGFPDKKLWRKSPSGEMLYRSSSLEKLWPFGHSEIGSVTYQSSAYVARYILKKIGGEMAEEHYRRVHPLTGVECNVSPEFITMSTNPGIGREWFEKFASDAFPSDFVVIDGQKHPVPAYYKKMISDREAFLVVVNRKKRSLLHKDNNTPERLKAREEVQAAKLNRLKRDMEN